MFELIMVPVDLTKEENLERALSCAADLTRTNKSKVCYVGVTTAIPNTLAHTPAKYEKRLADFAKGQSDLLRAVKETSADLVVMATHKPGIGDYIWPSNGGRIAAQVDTSVLLVRS